MMHGLLAFAIWTFQKAKINAAFTSIETMATCNASLVTSVGRVLAISPVAFAIAAISATPCAPTPSGQAINAVASTNADQHIALVATTRMKRKRTVNAKNPRLLIV
jgi:hypothetical protein